MPRITTQERMPLPIRHTTAPNRITSTVVSDAACPFFDECSPNDALFALDVIQPPPGGLHDRDAAVQDRDGVLRIHRTVGAQVDSLFELRNCGPRLDLQ